MVEEETLDYDQLNGFSVANGFEWLLFKCRDEGATIAAAARVARVYDWSYDGICSYFSSPFVGCWPVVSSPQRLKKEHQKKLLPEWDEDEGLKDILKSPFSRVPEEMRAAEAFVFTTYLSLIEALKNGRLRAKGRESALAPLLEIPLSLWRSRFTFLDLRRNELLRVDGERWSVIGEDLEFCSLPPIGASVVQSEEEGAASFVEADVRRFLKSQADQPRRAKKVIKAEAIKRFPGLSGRRFDRLWAEHAPASFKAAGRIS